MDSDGYPTEEELDRIRAWPYEDYAGLLEFIGDNCWWPSRDSGGFKRLSGGRYRLATGGWSGNEEVIAVLEQNIMFMPLCWKSSHRGGLHIFEVPEIEPDDPLQQEKEQ
jgi:hypothetical protein